MCQLWALHVVTKRQFFLHLWIYRLLFVFFCVCLFVRLQISPARIKLAASNFARWFIGVLGRESPCFGELCSPRSPKSYESASAHRHIAYVDTRQSPSLTPRAHVNITVDMCRRKLHARDAPFVEYHVACGRRIGMCGYTAVPDDGRILY